MYRWKDGWLMSRDEIREQEDSNSAISGLTHFGTIAFTVLYCCIISVIGLWSCVPEGILTLVVFVILFSVWVAGGILISRESRIAILMIVAFILCTISFVCNFESDESKQEQSTNKEIKL